MGISLPSRREILLGPELLVNGDFATDTVWVKGANWAIASGVASASGPASASFLSQTLSLTAGDLYFVQFTVSAYTGGAVRARFRNAGLNVAPIILTAVANGTYSGFSQLSGAADTFAFEAPNSLAVYSIDNASLRKVYS